MKDEKLHRLVLTALFAALTAAATMAVRVPTPFGYANLGDGIVLLGAFLLGPLCGTIAGAVGSGLADLLAGYEYYVPGTVLIKGGMALIAALIAARAKENVPSVPRLIAASVPAELFMVAGYFGYKALILGRYESAVVSVTSNLVQGAVGVAVGVLLTRLLLRVPEIEAFRKKGR